MIVCLSISFFKIKNIKEINPIIIKIRLCTNEWVKKKLVIYEIKINEKNDIKIKMTLTNPNCPVAGTMPESVGKSVENISNLNSIEVSLVWHPKWHKDLMSEEAKLALDIF